MKEAFEIMSSHPLLTLFLGFCFLVTVNEIKEMVIETTKAILKFRRSKSEREIKKTYERVN